MRQALEAWCAWLSWHGAIWLVQSTALLAFGLVVGRLARRAGPAVQNGVYRATLAGVLVCPAASALLAAAGIDGPGFPMPSARPEIRAVAVPSLALPESPAIGRAETGGGAMPELRSAPPPPLVASNRPDPGPAPKLAVEASVPEPTAAWRMRAELILAAWFVVASLLALRLTIGQARMRRLRRLAAVAGPHEQGLCAELARRLGVLPPGVLRSPFLHSPCLDGLRRPAILLPEDADQNLRETLVHELAHLVRRDALWNLLRHSATVLGWYQPLLWILSRRLEATSEEVCDDFVVQIGTDRARYAGHLLALATRTLPPPSPSAVGMISLRSMLARRVIRILDVSRRPCTRLGVHAAGLILAAGAAATGLAGLLGAGQAVREVKDTGPKVETSAGGTSTATLAAAGRASGQVLGPDGKPVAGATVIASRSRYKTEGFGGTYQNARTYQSVRGTTDADGRFSLDVATPETDINLDPMSPEADQRFEVVATAPGLGLSYQVPGRPIRLEGDDLPITGRLVDLEGRPVAGARIRIRQLYLRPQAESGRAGRADNSSSARVGRSVLDGEPILPGGVATDAAGRFRIEGLGREVMALLEISGPRVAFQRVSVMTREMTYESATPHDPGTRGFDRPGLFGADCTIPVEPSRPVEGVVRDPETERPIPGAMVTAWQLSGSTLLVEGQIAAEADAQGHYHLEGLPKGERNILAVYPPLDQPYFMTHDLVVPGGPGLNPVTFDIGLKRGRWIIGRVTDQKTGKPVRASVEYFPMLANPHAKDYPNFDPNVTSIAISSRYRTDADGRYRVVGLPGRGVVAVHTDDRSYRAGVGAEGISGAEPGNLATYNRIFPQNYQGLRAVDVPEVAGEFTCDLTLDPGLSIAVRIQDERGNPLKGATIYGRFPEFVDHGDHNLYATSETKISGLEPGKPRLVIVKHLSRKLGAIVNLAADRASDPAELALVLRPCAVVAGRLIDTDGKPAKGGVVISVKRPGTVESGSERVGDAKLDADGRFRCDDLPPGYGYEVMAADRLVYGYRGKMEPEAFGPFPLARDLALEAGKTMDLGTFNVATGKRVEGPAALAAPADLPILGRIVDLEGRPVPGVRVKVEGYRCPRSGNLDEWLAGVKAGSPPWVTANLIDWEKRLSENATKEAVTDKDGRFRLAGIGAERNVELELRGDTIAFNRIEVVTRKMPPLPAPGFGNQYGPGSQTVYGAKFTYTAAPCRPIEGVVKDSKTGEPLTGVEVRSTSFAGSNWIGTMALRVKTDAQGRFGLLGMPRGKNKLLLVPNDEQPYFLHDEMVPDPQGAGRVKMEIGLTRGLWIEGKLTEEGTGKPVAEARLFYAPFLENTFAQAAPEFGKDRNVDGVEYQDRYLSKPDGSFRLVGMPGRALVGALAVNREYMTGAGYESIKGLGKNGYFESYWNPVPWGRNNPTVMKEINPPSDASVMHVELQVRYGDTVRYRVLDSEGKPATGTAEIGLTGRGSFNRDQKDHSEGVVRNLYPDEERTLMFRDEKRKLGKVIRVRKGDDVRGPVVVTLEPLATITGRVLDADRNPVSGATIRPDLLPGGDFSPRLDQVSAGPDGRFTVPDVPAGCEYGLAVESSDQLPNRRFAYSKDVKVKPGATTELSEIRFKND